jgi:CRP-like cAMP-binding protein
MRQTGTIITALPFIADKGNYLIDRLPQHERRRILSRCKMVQLAHGTVLCESDKPFDYIYFPVSGCISLVKTLDSHEPFETELIGCEGMIGVTLVLGIPHASQHAMVQSPSLALRMTAAQLNDLIEHCPELYRTLQCYLFVVIVQLSQTAGCTRFHDVSARLARGLLMAHDRARSDRFHLTHQILADMLGVQRGAVTIAAGHLRRNNIIQYTRGEITILDRQQLEAASCECYRTDIKHYASLMS